VEDPQGQKERDLSNLKDSWLNRDEVEDVVKKSWCMNDRGSPMYRISRKLKGSKKT